MRRRKSRLTRFLLHLANLLVILVFLLPVIAALVGSLQSEKTLEGNTRAILPPEWTLDNYKLFLSGGMPAEGSIYSGAAYVPDSVKHFYTALENSTIVAVSVTVLTLGFAALSAYTIARLRLRWLLWMMNINVFARFLPVITLMIPIYVTFRRLNMLNSLYGIVIAETGLLLPFGMLILMPYFAAVPKELEEAARIDGCTRFSACWRIVLRVSTPALVSFGAIVFIVSWNDLLTPLILTSSTDTMTLPLIMVQLIGDSQVFFGTLTAIGLMVMAPTVLLALLLQKYVVQGLTAGAVKG